jgi:hypothetical protein
VDKKQHQSTLDKICVLYNPERDATGQKLAYLNFEDEPGRGSAANLLSKDEARRIAANIAKLPELVRRSG